MAAVTAAALVLRPSQQAASGGTHSPTTGPSAAAAAILAPQRARGFDEPSTHAGLAIDGKPATRWQTQFYLNNPVFGGLKSGSGLLLDMGKEIQLSSITVELGPTPGADVAIKVGNDGSRTQASMASFTTVAQATDLSGTHTFAARPAAKGRYVLIWFTRLPPQANGPKNHYEAEIFNIIVKGSG